MNNNKSILAVLMKEADIDDIQLSKHTGVPVSTITRTRLAKNSNPTASTLKPLSDFFNISIDCLLGREELPKDRLPGLHRRNSYATSILPIINWKNIHQYIYSPDESKLLNWLSSEKPTSEGSFAIYIPNDELALFLKKGSTILIDKTKDVITGDLIVLHTNKNAISLKKILIDGDKIFLKSVTPGINSIIPMKNDYKIIGKVIEIRYALQEDMEPTTNSVSQNNIRIRNFAYSKAT